MRALKRLGIVLAVLLAIEAAVRLSGVGDIAFYGADPDLGYFVLPGQHGAYLHWHRWEFNERGMGAGPYRPEGRRNVVLLGDSLVLGGNPIGQERRLGPVLERELGAPWAVWPIAAESWSAANEAAWLRRNADVVDRAEWLVWVLNDGDFQGKSAWRSDLLNPRRRPLWETLFVFEKYVWLKRVEPRLPAGFPRLVPPDPEGKLPLETRFPDFAEFVRALRRERPGLRVCVVWYPEVAELNPPPGDFFLRTAARLRALADETGITLVDLAHAPGWSPAEYRDILHPNAAGNAAFARILKPILETAPSPRP